MKFLSAAGEACKPKQYAILTASRLESGTLWEGGEGESLSSASAVPQCEDTPTELQISQTDPSVGNEEVFAFNSSSATYVGRVRENPGGSLACNPIHKVLHCYSVTRYTKCRTVTV